MKDEKNKSFRQMSVKVSPKNFEKIDIISHEFGISYSAVINIAISKLFFDETVNGSL